MSSAAPRTARLAVLASIAVVAVPALLLLVAQPAGAHSGHPHVPLGPPAPDWVWGSTPTQQQAQQRDSDRRGRARFAIELAQAPVEQRGKCVDTVEFSDVGEGCRTTDGLLRLVGPGGDSLLTHGPDYLESELTTSSTLHEPRTVAAVRNASKADVSCVPEGEARTQVIYAIPADGVDRSATRVPQLRRAVYEVSAVIDAESRSLSSTAGRRLRVRCDVDGEANVRVMRLGTRGANATFSTVRADIHAIAGTASGVGTIRYLVYYDAHLGNFSGIGQFSSDEQPGADNVSNAGGRVALQDASEATAMPNWKTLLHEAGHNMGAVQDGAPDANNLGHCNDGVDVMCYSEEGVAGWVGPYVADACRLQQFDCGHDSYFHPSPPAGSYLASNWNVASTANRYLQAWAAPADSAAPTAPTGLSATGHGTFVRLTWNAAGDGAGSGVHAYRVYLQDGADWRPVGDSWPGDLTIDASWDTINANTTYTLRVRAYDQRGNEGPPADVGVSTGSITGQQQVAGGTLPAPTDVRVTASTSSSLTLAWEPVAGAPGTRYRIERRVGTGPWSWYTTSTTTRSITGLVAGQRHELVVSAYDGDGRRSTTTTLHAWTSGGPDVTAPAAPTGLSITSVDGAVPTVGWSAVPDAASYVVGVNDGTWSTVATTTNLTSQVPGLDWGSTRTLGVAARDEAGNTSGWTTVSHTTPATPDTTPPTDVPSLSTTRTTTSLTPSWGASSDAVGVVGYRVFIGVKDTANAWLGASTPAATRTATITGLVPGTTYTVRIQALDAAGNGSSMNSWWYLTTATDSIAPTTPTGLAASSQTGTSMRLAWNASTDASGVAHYVIERLSPGPVTQLGTTSDTQYDVTGLAVSTSYTFAVRAVDVAGNASGTVQVTSSTGAGDVTAPTTPTGPAAGSITGSGMQLTWNASGDDVGVAGYRVYRTSPSPSGTPIADVSHPSTGAVLTGLASHTTYTFSITAYDAAGNESTGATITATTLDVVAPTTPGAIGVGAVTGTSIPLSWGASTDGVGVAGYRVYRLSPSASGTPIASTGGTSTTITGLASGTTYTFAVTAVDAAGNESAQRTVTTSTLDVTAPTVPGAVVVGTVTGSSVALSWGASTDAVGVTGYRVYRTSPSASGTPIASPAGTSTTITGLQSAVSYSFAVTAVDAAGNESGQRAVVVATADVVAPSTPGAFAADALGETSVRLTWTASTDNAAVAGYRVLRVVAGVPSVLGTTTSLQYDVTALQAATTYAFRVEAFDSAGNASTRAAAGVTTPDLTAPTSPTSLAATERTDSRIRLAWSASTDAVGVVGYRIHRTAPTASGTPIGTTAATSFDVEALAAATEYGFAVTAIDAAGNESVQASVTASTLDEPDVVAPGAPTGLAVSWVTQAGGAITWAAPVDADVVRYRVERLDGASWTTIAEPTATSYELSGLAAGTGYSLRVRALDATGSASLPSASVVLQTEPAADTTAPTTPAGPVGSSGTADGTMGLVWGASADAGGIAHYRIWLATGSGWSPIATSTATSATITGLAAGWSTISITAVDTAGNESARLTTSVFVPSVVIRSLPGAPSGLWATTTSSTITLGWQQDAGDDAASWTVRAIRGGVLVDTRSTTAPTVTFGPFPANASVTFEVLATNATGQGAAASITASTQPDRVRPSRVARLFLRPRGSGRVLATWTPSRDASGIRRYQLLLTTPRTRARIVSTRTARRTVTIARLSRGRTYLVRVRAIDRAGNVGFWSRPIRVRVR